MIYEDNIKKTWEMIKEKIVKTKIINNNLPEKFIDNERNILHKKEIANEFNKFFVILKQADKNRTIKMFF